ncbi:hypothetical protein BDQ12DRAFT_714310 [Crucibulum laeve]|uniref:F-box domain-containing protein n=1 Tax=Crucibulum laeve TaxID=68775 RepID=A0A5C3LVZ4_9AGAR|nr:hypothetical protein BDQ12DRAFT_714310 [Crucibulum laeve]
MRLLHKFKKLVNMPSLLLCCGKGDIYSSQEEETGLLHEAFGAVLEKQVPLLPLDIFCHVLTFADACSIRALALTSRGLHDITVSFLRRLYKVEGMCLLINDDTLDALPYLHLIFLLSSDLKSITWEIGTGRKKRRNIISETNHLRKLVSLAPSVYTIFVVFTSSVLLDASEEDQKLFNSKFFGLLYIIAQKCINMAITDAIPGLPLTSYPDKFFLYREDSLVVLEKAGKCEPAIAKRRTTALLDMLRYKIGLHVQTQYMEAAYRNYPTLYTLKAIALHSRYFFQASTHDKTRVFLCRVPIMRLSIDDRESNDYYCLVLLLKHITMPKLRILYFRSSKVSTHNIILFLRRHPLVNKLAIRKWLLLEPTSYSNIGVTKSIQLPIERLDIKDSLMDNLLNHGVEFIGLSTLIIDITDLRLVNSILSRLYDADYRIPTLCFRFSHDITWPEFHSECFPAFLSHDLSPSAMSTLNGVQRFYLNGIYLNKGRFFARDKMQKLFLSLLDPNLFISLRKVVIDEMFVDDELELSYVYSYATEIVARKRLNIDLFVNSNQWTTRKELDERTTCKSITRCINEEVDGRYSRAAASNTVDPFDDRNSPKFTSSERIHEEVDEGDSRAAASDTANPFDDRNSPEFSSSGYICEEVDEGDSRAVASNITDPFDDRNAPEWSSSKRGDPFSDINGVLAYPEVKP